LLDSTIRDLLTLLPIEDYQPEAEFTMGPDDDCEDDFVEGSARLRSNARGIISEYDMYCYALSKDIRSILEECFVEAGVPNRVDCEYIALRSGILVEAVEYWCKLNSQIWKPHYVSDHR
jgi:hypothetical protein